jgi:hypothetical protein
MAKIIAPIEPMDPDTQADLAKKAEHMLELLRAGETFKALDMCDHIGAKLRIITGTVH